MLLVLAPAALAFKPGASSRVVSTKAPRAAAAVCMAGGPMTDTDAKAAWLAKQNGGAWVSGGSVTPTQPAVSPPAYGQDQEAALKVMQEAMGVVETAADSLVALDKRIQALEASSGGRPDTYAEYTAAQGGAPAMVDTRTARILGPVGLVAGAVAATFAFTSATAPAPITLDELVEAQRNWGNALVGISNTYLKGGDYVAAATKAADELYGYGRTDVLFKPTKASVDPFRPTAAGALSYFVGGDKVPDGGFAEDHGFALGPGGVGWKKVVFDNNKIDFNGATATAMGEYYFYSAADDSVAKVEYTFGYKRNDDGKIRIYLHHSSLPYTHKKAGPAPVAPITMDEIVSAQRTWGDAIVSISKTYLSGGDVIAAASKAADELYGYGRTDVLFKPTKASIDPFRPTAAGALSYFVGGDKITPAEGGFAEDKGFALGPGGVGWKKVIFDNNKIDFNGGTAQAMGEYYFYSAADDSVSKVEYTFGYKRNDDGKIRIYLHHSSLPYVPH